MAEFNLAQGDLAQFLCAHCGGNYLHFSGEPVFEASDDYPDLGLGLRGDVLTIPLWCEFCPDRSRVVVQFHKGQMYVGTVPVPVAPKVESEVT